MACKQMICVFNLKKQNKKKVPNFPLEEKKKSHFENKGESRWREMLEPWASDAPAPSQAHGLPFNLRTTAGT